MYWSQKLDFFCLTFGVQYIFNSLIYFLISHNYFTCPDSSNSFFSITYATFASLLNKEHISIMLQKLSDRKIPFICNLLPTFYFTFLTEKIIIRSIFFGGFYVISIKKLGRTVSLSYYIYHLLGFRRLSARCGSTCFRHFYRNDSPSLSHFL